MPHILHISSTTKYSPQREEDVGGRGGGLDNNVAWSIIPDIHESQVLVWARQRCYSLKFSLYAILVQKYHSVYQPFERQKLAMVSVWAHVCGRGQMAISSERVTQYKQLFKNMWLSGFTCLSDTCIRVHSPRLIGAAWYGTVGWWVGTGRWSNRGPGIKIYIF